MKNALTRAAPNWLLSPPGALWGLAARLRAAIGGLGQSPNWKAPCPCLGIGAMAPGERGQMLLCAWIMGWIQANNIEAALIAEPGPAKQPDMPYQVESTTPAEQAGSGPFLLARYRPKIKVLVDRDPVRAAKAACLNQKPNLLILYDLFSHPGLGHRADMVLLNSSDLEHGWGRLFPIGTWREGVKALQRAGAFVLHLTPAEWPRHQALAERRLASFGKPVFTVWPRIWQLRHVPDGQTTRDLNGEPYLLAATETQVEVISQAAQDYLKTPPRFTVTFTDNHRPTLAQAEELRQEAKRFKCRHILVSPQVALFLPAPAGRGFWTFDPEVAFGPGPSGNNDFAAWWERQWLSIQQGER